MKTQIGSRIKEIRKQKNMTLTGLAAQMRVSAAALSRIENGLNTPSMNTLYKLSRVLGVTTDEIVIGAFTPVTALGASDESK